MAAGVAYLRTVSLFYLICFWGAIYQGYLRGAGILDVQYYVMAKAELLQSSLKFV